MGFSYKLFGIGLSFSMMIFGTKLTTQNKLSNDYLLNRIIPDGLRIQDLLEYEEFSEVKRSAKGFADKKDVLRYFLVEEFDGDFPKTVYVWFDKDEPPQSFDLNDRTSLDLEDIVEKLPSNREIGVAEIRFNNLIYRTRSALLAQAMEVYDIDYYTKNDGEIKVRDETNFEKFRRNFMFENES